MNNVMQAQIDEFNKAMHDIWDTWDEEWSYKWQDTTVHKMGQMAENLSVSVGGNFDFVDYWFNFFLSNVKDEIDKHFLLGINALWYSIWQEKFEECYFIKDGDPLTGPERYWFASYMEGLVFSFRCSPKIIAQYYGLDGFRRIAEGYQMFHCMGYDAFVQEIITEYGKPDAVERVEALHC